MLPNTTLEFVSFQLEPEKAAGSGSGSAPHCCSPESYIRKADLLRYKPFYWSILPITTPEFFSFKLEPEKAAGSGSGSAPHCCSSESYIRKADLVRYKTVLIRITDHDSRILLKGMKCRDADPAGFDTDPDPDIHSDDLFSLRVHIWLLFVRGSNPSNYQKKRYLCIKN